MDIIKQSPAQPRLKKGKLTNGHSIFMDCENASC